MKIDSKELIHTPLIDSKGDSLGKIEDLLFEDIEWKIRYVVVDTGTWLRNRLTLVAPDHLLLTPQALEKGKIPCTLDKITIEGCPPLDVDAPVSRRYEAEFASYYKASPYWLGSPVWGMGDASAMVPPPPEKEAEHDQAMEEIERCHMRSTTELEGYDVVATNDVSLGEVERFDINWDPRRIINIVAKEGGLLHRKHERDIAPENVREIDWHLKRVFLTIPYEKEEVTAGSETVPGTGVPAPQFLQMMSAPGGAEERFRE